MLVKKMLGISALPKLLVAGTLAGVTMISPVLVGTQPAQAQEASFGGLFSPNQLDNLLAPLALYPDPLLAQGLVAATFPDQIDAAARLVRAGADAYAIDAQPWDTSVKAVAHYPTMLYLMADDLDWTTALGQAYVDQAPDVTDSIQRLRAQAQAAGNLVASPQEQIVDTDGYIRIWPAQPQYIYVPLYDPAEVYSRRGRCDFGSGLPIGPWLNDDIDWVHHDVFYHGWNQAGGWVARSRPYIRASNVYINNNYRHVRVNSTVVNRAVNDSDLNRYNSVHHAATYNDVRQARSTPRRGANAQPVTNPYRDYGQFTTTRTMRRNGNLNDPTIAMSRNRETAPTVINRPPANRTMPNRPVVNLPQPVSPQPVAPPPNLWQSSRRQPDAVRPDRGQPTAPQFTARRQDRSQLNPVPAYRPQMRWQAAPAPAAPSRQVERLTNAGFGGRRGGFTPQAANQRGPQLAPQMTRPAPQGPTRDERRRR